VRNSSLIVCLLLLCLVIRILWFVGIGPNDDLSYIQHARNLGEGANILENGGSQLAFRLGMVLPLAVLYKAFGYTEAAFSAYPLICTLITCLFIYLTAESLWGRQTAVLAALLWIVYPLQIVFDTQLSPSNQHAACVAAGLFFYIHAAKALENRAWPAWQGNAVLILSGALMGVGWLVNELFVLMGIAAIPVLIVLRPRAAYIYWALLGFALIIFADMLIGYYASGSWFARIFCIDATEKIVVSNKDPNYLPRTLFHVFNVNPIYDEGHFGILWLLFIFVPLSAWYEKQWLALGLSLSVWLIPAYLQWGVVSLEGEPITKYIRYLSMIVPLQCLATAAICSHMIQKHENWRWAIRSLFALMVIHLFIAGTNTAKAARIHTADYRKIASVLLQNYKGDPVYTDHRTAIFVQLFSEGKLTFEIVENYSGKPKPLGGYLVVDGSASVIEIPGYRAAMPSWYRIPPKNWDLIHVVAGENKARYDKFDPKIYQIN